MHSGHQGHPHHHHLQGVSDVAHAAVVGSSTSRARPKLPLAPDHEQAGAGDDRRADIDQRLRQFAEQPITEQHRPQHRAVVERRHCRGHGVAVAFGEQDMREAAEHAERDETGQLGGRRRVPVERQRQRAGDGADQREIKHDRRGRLALRQPPRLDHGAGVADAGADREQRADGRGCGADGGVMANAEIGDQHHDDAGKADDHRRPAVDAHAFLQDQRRQRDRNERRGKGNGGDVGERQPHQRGEIREHAADAEQAAAELAERARGAHRGAELAAQA